MLINDIASRVRLSHKFVPWHKQNYRSRMNTRLLPAIGGPLAFFGILLFFHPTGLSEAGVAVLASTVWIAVWWIFEVTHIAVTALLPIILFPVTGALGLSATTASYGHKFIFLYMGGFILAMTIEKWGLHKRIALHIINALGAGISRIILGFMVATAFLSMWISNTATTVMMLPIALAIVQQLKDHPDTKANENQLFGKALMLAIAYSASIGGMATLFGTPPNLVLAGVVEKTFGVEIGFAQWFQFGFPISVLLLTICWLYLTRFAFRFELQAFPGGRAEIRRLIHALGRMSREETTVLIIFGFTALGLIGRQWLQRLLPGLDDTVVAMTAGLVLFLWPSSKKGGTLIGWPEAVRLPWGVLILFGGGMALAAGFDQSGLAEWIGTQFEVLKGLPLILLVLILVAAVNFLTEITSNVATTAMLLPILAAMALNIDIHPYILLVSATVAASCAFMLPVATPPNAIVFGSGYLTIPDMMRTGIWMNILSVILLTLAVYGGLSWLWGFDPEVVPAAWR